MPGTVQAAVDTLVNKRDMVPALRGDRDDKTISK